MQRFKFFLSLFLILASRSTFAYTPKEGNVTATLGPYIHKTNYKPFYSDGPNTPYMGGLALIANGDVNDRGALEIAIVQMPKRFFREVGPLVVGEETQLMHITMGYRRWWSPYLSSSMSFYSSYTMGSPKIIYSEFPVGQEPDTSARDVTEYGFVFSIQSEVWSEDRYAAVVDARYALSLTAKENEQSDHYALLVGVRYFIQGKEDNRP